MRPEEATQAPEVAGSFCGPRIIVTVQRALCIDSVQKHNHLPGPDVNVRLTDFTLGWHDGCALGAEKAQISILFRF